MHWLGNYSSIWKKEDKLDPFKILYVLVVTTIIYNQGNFSSFLDTNFRSISLIHSAKNSDKLQLFSCAG